MPISSNPLIQNTRSTPTALKLVEASGLHLPAQPDSRIVPVPTEKVTLHSKPKELSDVEQAEISSLKARDSKVHQHVQAHLSAAGGLNVSRSPFFYQRGPDGVNYAVGGDVRINTSDGRTAEDRLAQGQKIIDVALAPSDPSPSDRSAAANGQSMVQQASAELLKKSQPTQQDINQVYDDKPISKNIDTFA